MFQSHALHHAFLVRSLSLSLALILLHQPISQSFLIHFVSGFLLWKERSSAPATRRLLNPSLRQGTKALPRDQWYRDRPLPNLRFDGSGRGPLARWSSKLKRFLGIAIQKGERDGMIILIMRTIRPRENKHSLLSSNDRHRGKKSNTYTICWLFYLTSYLTYTYSDFFFWHLIWHSVRHFTGHFFSGIWFCNRHAGPARRAPESERDGVSEIWRGLTSQLVGKNENKNNLVT